MDGRARSPTLGVFVPAYNAARTLGPVIDRIPADAWQIIDALFVIDDGSADDTSAVAGALASRCDRIRLVRHQANRGYGETVRHGMRLCLERGSDFAACLHADGQYPPETLVRFATYMLDHGVDVLQGSRHKDGGALAGGMPLYKYAAGKALTALENAVFGLRLTDYHSGYLVYSRKALRTVPIDRLSGYFDFDLEFIARARRHGLVIDELAIPTRYGDEVSYLNPVRYGFRAVGVMVSYMAGRYG